MSPFTFLYRRFVRAGGVIVYYLAKTATGLVNIFAKKVPIGAETGERLRIFFPELDLRRVRIIENAKLPANWFRRRDRITGVTFGCKIYTRKAGLETDYEGMLLLIHELVHVGQMRQDSEWKFAARYGEEYLRHGYPNMPLEKEAYQFVSRIPFNPAFYLERYADVNKNVHGSFAGAFAHWLDCGIMEGRDSTRFFNSRKYYENQDNGDLEKDFGPDNFKAGVLHWILTGKAGGRRGN